MIGGSVVPINLADSKAEIVGRGIDANDEGVLLRRDTYNVISVTSVRAYLKQLISNLITVQIDVSTQANTVCEEK